MICLIYYSPHSVHGQIQESWVAHEQPNLATRRKFLIPNVCRHFGVRFVDTFELLNALEARFVLGE